MYMFDVYKYSKRLYVHMHIGSVTFGPCTVYTTGGGTRAWPSKGPSRASYHLVILTAWMSPR